MQHCFGKNNRYHDIKMICDIQTRFIAIGRGPIYCARCNHTTHVAYYTIAYQSGPHWTRNAWCYGCDVLWHGCVMYAEITGAGRTGAIHGPLPTRNELHNGCYLFLILLSCNACMAGWMSRGISQWIMPSPQTDPQRNCPPCAHDTM